MTRGTSWPVNRLRAVTSVKQSGEQRAGGVRGAVLLPLVAHYRQSLSTETQKSSRESQLTYTQSTAFSKHASILVIQNICRQIQYMSLLSETYLHMKIDFFFKLGTVQ